MGGILKVLHVITGLGVGGAENMLASLLLDGAETDAHVVSLIPGGAVAERLLAAGIPVSDMGMRRNRLGPPGIFRLARLIREMRPDVIQGWMYHADLAATMALTLSGRRQDTVLAWGVRCSDMDTRKYSWKLRLVIALCARLSHYPDVVVFNSEAGAAVHRALGYRPLRAEVIDNGIDTGRFHPDAAARAAVRAELHIPGDRPVLAHVARVDPMKDHDCFLAALEKLPDVTALAVGEGTEKLPDRPGLIRLGRRDDVARLLAACDVMISSSAFGEGFSNAIAEGMAVGLPAAATDVGDTRRIVGDTGRVVPPRDPDALAKAIRELIALGPEGRAGLGARARIEREFPLSRPKAEFSKLYRETQALLGLS